MGQEDDRDFFARFLQLDAPQFVTSTSEQIDSYVDRGTKGSMEGPRLLTTTIQSYVNQPHISPSSPLGLISQAMEEADDLDEMNDEELFYFLESMSDVFRVMNKPNTSASALISQDDSYEFLGELSENLKRLVSGGGNSITSSIAQSKAANDWRPPSTSGLANSAPLISKELLNDIKRDFETKAERRASMESSYKDEDTYADAKNSTSSSSFNNEDKGAPLVAEYKGAESKNEETKDWKFEAKEGDVYDDEVDDDDDDDDDDEDDEEEDYRPPATMSAGLMRMLGMEVKDELETDWIPPDVTGLGNSDPLVENSRLRAEGLALGR